MKKFIAPVVALGAALSLTPAPANAASLSEFKDQWGNSHCRITLNDAEKGPANQAERAAKTLTNGAWAIAYVEAFEVTFPGVKQVGDEYVAAITGYLTEVREGKEPSAASKTARDAARAAAKVKLKPLGLEREDADSYLDNKETAQNPEVGTAGKLSTYAEWYIGINGGSNPISKLHPNHKVGNLGETSAATVYHVTNEKRAAFASNMNKTYYGTVINALESAYLYPLRNSTKCVNGETHIIFPTKIDLPELKTYQNPELGKAAPKPKPEEENKPAPTPKLPDLNGLSSKNADGSPNVAAIIGTIVAVLAAIGGILAGLQSLR